MSLPLTPEQEDWLKCQAHTTVIYANEYEPNPEIERGKHYVRTAGYAAKLGSGPSGETCKSCQHAVYIKMAGKYWKCKLSEKLWKGSRKTDILLSAPACERWERKTV
jgi:hypothetical protein